MKSSGLVEMGYQYLNLDDCWQSSIRDEEGSFRRSHKFSERN